MAIDVSAPQSGKGILMIIGAVILVATALEVMALGTIALAAIILIAVGYVLVVAGGRFHDWFRHGKPLIRRGKGRKSESGGGDGGR